MSSSLAHGIDVSRGGADPHDDDANPMIDSWTPSATETDIHSQSDVAEHIVMETKQLTQPVIKRRGGSVRFTSNSFRPASSASSPSTSDSDSDAASDTDSDSEDEALNAAYRQALRVASLPSKHKRSKRAKMRKQTRMATDMMVETQQDGVDASDVDTRRKLQLNEFKEETNQQISRNPIVSTTTLSHHGDESQNRGAPTPYRSLRVNTTSRHSFSLSSSPSPSGSPRSSGHYSGRHSRHGSGVSIRSTLPMSMSSRMNEDAQRAYVLKSFPQLADAEPFFSPTASASASASMGMGMGMGVRAPSGVTSANARGAPRSSPHIRNILTNEKKPRSRNRMSPHAEHESSEAGVDASAFTALLTGRHIVADAQPPSSGLHLPSLPAHRTHTPSSAILRAGSSLAAAAASAGFPLPIPAHDHAHPSDTSGSMSERMMGSRGPSGVGVVAPPGSRTARQQQRPQPHTRASTASSSNGDEKEQQRTSNEDGAAHDDQAIQPRRVSSRAKKRGRLLLPESSPFTLPHKLESTTQQPLPPRRPLVGMRFGSSNNSSPRHLPTSPSTAPTTSVSSSNEFSRVTSLQHKLNRWSEGVSQRAKALLRAKIQDRNIAPMTSHREQQWVQMIMRACKEGRLALADNGLSRHSCPEICALLSMPLQPSLHATSAAAAVAPAQSAASHATSSSSCHSPRPVPAPSIPPPIRSSLSAAPLHFRSIDVGGNHLGDEGVCMLADALLKSSPLVRGELRSLSVRSNRLSSKGIESLSRALLHASIETLDLSSFASSASTSASVSSSAVSMSTSNLRMDIHASNYIGPGLSGVKALRRLLEQSETLTSLNLASCGLGLVPGALEALFHGVASSRSLTHLDLRSNSIEAQEVDIITAALDGIDEEADDDHEGEKAGYVDRRTMMSESFLTQHGQVEEEDQDDETRHPSAALSSTSRSSSQSPLHSLLLSHNNLGSMGLGRLARFLRSRSSRCALRTLDVSRCRAGLVGWLLLSDALPQAYAIDKLILDGNDLGSEIGAACIRQEWKRGTSAEALDYLSSCLRSFHLRDRFVSFRFPQNRSLCTLSLRGCHLSDRFGNQIFDLLTKTPHPSLHTLNLAENKLSKVSGMAAAEFLATNPTLKTLDLSFNRIGDVAGMAIVRALATSNTNLTSLRMQETDLGEATANNLLNMLSIAHSSLTQVNIEGNTISYTAFQRIRELTMKNSKAFNTHHANVERLAEELDALRRVDSKLRETNEQIVAAKKLDMELKQQLATLEQDRMGRCGEAAPFVVQARQELDLLEQQSSTLSDEHRRALAAEFQVDMELRKKRSEMETLMELRRKERDAHRDAQVVAEKLILKTKDALATFIRESALDFDEGDRLAILIASLQKRNAAARALIESDLKKLMEWMNALQKKIERGEANPYATTRKMEARGGGAGGSGGSSSDTGAPSSLTVPSQSHRRRRSSMVMVAALPPSSTLSMPSAHPRPRRASVATAHLLPRHALSGAPILPPNIEQLLMINAEEYDALIKDSDSDDNDEKGELQSRIKKRSTGRGAFGLSPRRALAVSGGGSGHGASSRRSSLQPPASSLPAGPSSTASPSTPTPRGTLLRPHPPPSSTAPDTVIWSQPQPRPAALSPTPTPPSTADSSRSTASGKHKSKKSTNKKSTSQPPSKKMLSINEPSHSQDASAGTATASIASVTAHSQASTTAALTHTYTSAPTPTPSDSWTLRASSGVAPAPASPPTPGIDYQQQDHVHMQSPTSTPSDADASPMPRMDDDGNNEGEDSGGDVNFGFGGLKIVVDADG